jgi:hypothetical protein
VKNAVGEARGVRQQLAQRDLGFGGPQARVAGGREALEHLRFGQQRQMRRHWPVEGCLALLHELHRRDRDDGLGHRGDLEDRIRSDRDVRGSVTCTETA